MNRKQINLVTMAALSTLSSAAFAAATAVAPAPTFTAPRSAPVPAVRPNASAPGTRTEGNVTYPAQFNNRLQQMKQNEAQAKPAAVANDNAQSATAENSCDLRGTYNALTKDTFTSPDRAEAMVQAGVIQIAANDCGAAVVKYSVPARKVLLGTGECALNLNTANDNEYVHGLADCQAKTKNQVLGTTSATAETELKNVEQESIHCSLFPHGKAAFQRLNAAK